MAKKILVSLPAPSPRLGEADRLAGTRSGTLVASGRQCGIVTCVVRFIVRDSMGGMKIGCKGRTPM